MGGGAGGGMPCVPRSCASDECGTVNNGCGLPLVCGDCPSSQMCGSVTPNRCGTPRCMNGVADGDESDVDCGGSCSARCSLHQRCKTTADCSGNTSCEAMKCVPGRWVPLASMPAPRGNTASIAVGNKVYVFGGLNDDIAVTNNTFIYDGALNQWSEGAAFPGPRQFGATALLPDGRIALIGGHAFEADAGVSRRVDVYSPMTDSWSALPSLPDERSGACAVALPNGQLIVAGGFYDRDDENSLDSVARYEPDGGTWAVIPSVLHVPRSTAMCQHLPDGGLMITGGATTGSRYCTDQIEVLNPVSLTSTLTAPLPVPLTLTAGGILPNGTQWVLGGWQAVTSGSRSGYASDDSWVRTAGQPWSTAASVPERMYGFANTVAPDSGFGVLGGLRKTSGDFYPRALNTAWHFVP